MLATMNNYVLLLMCNGTDTETHILKNYKPYLSPLLARNILAHPTANLLPMCHACKMPFLLTATGTGEHAYLERLLRGYVDTVKL